MDRSQRKVARLVIGSLLLFSLVVITLLGVWKYRHIEFVITHGWEDYLVIPTEPLEAMPQPPEDWKEVTFIGGSLWVPKTAKIETIEQDLGYRTSYEKVDLGGGHKFAIFDEDISQADIDEKLNYLKDLPTGVPQRRQLLDASAFAASPEEFSWGMPRDALSILDFKLRYKRVICNNTNVGYIFLRSEDTWDGILQVSDKHATFTWESHDLRSSGTLLFEGANLQDYAWAKLISETVQIDSSPTDSPEFP